MWPWGVWPEWSLSCMHSCVCTASPAGSRPTRARSAHPRAWPACSTAAPEGGAPCNYQPQTAPKASDGSGGKTFPLLPPGAATLTLLLSLQQICFFT